jgi:hypothetical protein
MSFIEAVRRARELLRTEGRTSLRENSVDLVRQLD